MITKEFHTRLSMIQGNTSKKILVDTLTMGMLNIIKIFNSFIALTFTYSIMIRQISIIAVLSCIVALNSCKGPAGKVDQDLNDSTSLAIIPDSLDLKEGIPLFYNMYLTVDMASMFKSTGAVYDAALLNPATKSTNYVKSLDKALNLGVYAVDLSYARVFEQYENAGNYLNAMHKLSQELGIPSNKFFSLAERIEKNLTNKDSINIIANEIYQITDTYLKDNEREGTAALIILGGWVEAMYLALNIAVDKPGNIELHEKIGEQKYSLQSLSAMLRNFQDNETIALYLENLAGLQSLLDKYSPQEANLQASAGDFKAITSKVETIRGQIIN
jgi:hypothetical protein